MTHTLHRRENDQDYVILSMVEQGLNSENATEKLRKIFDIITDLDPVNTGNMTSKSEKVACMARGSSLDEIRESIDKTSIIHGVFINKADVEEAVKRISEADTGASVVVTGVFDEVFSILGHNNPSYPHTVNISLGEHGDISRLPKEEILEITTMCGHGLVSHKLVEKKMEQIAEGEISASKAAESLSKHCVCGVFNPEKAKKILRNTQT